MSLNVAVVTNSSWRHKYCACKLQEQLSVKCILIVEPQKPNNRIVRKMRQYGAVRVGLKVASKIYNRFSRNSYAHLLRAHEPVFFQGYDKKMAKLQAITYLTNSVNTPDTISLIKENKIDIICNLGGDIAKEEFINAARLFCLNIHSGVSPFYNGSASAAWTFSDHRPNFCGVTIMKMNERIDGGDILAHFLPDIHPEDKAHSLFFKGIAGGVNAMIKIVDDAEKFGIPTGIPQQRTVKFTRGMDWNIVNDIRLAEFHRSGKISWYCRDEKYFYYHGPSNKHGFALGPLLDFLLAKKK